jgi:hypothetical protein
MEPDRIRDLQPVPDPAGPVPTAPVPASPVPATVGAPPPIDEPTEILQLPTVVAVPEPPAAEVRASRWPTVALLAVVAALIAAGGVFAYSANDSLTRTRAELTTAQNDFATATTELASTNDELATTTAALEEEQAAIETAEDDIARLNRQVERQTVCIGLLRANLTEIERIFALQRANFRRTQPGSTFAKANNTALKAADKVATNLASAYSAAVAGNYTSAVSLLNAAEDQAGKAAAQVRTINKATDTINAKSDEINGARLQDTMDSCGI